MTNHESLTQRLQRHQRVLNELEFKRAGYTSLTVPTELIIQIEDEKRDIEILKAELSSLPINSNSQSNAIVSQIAQMDKAAEEKDWDTAIEIGEEILRNSLNRVALRRKVANAYGKRAENCIAHHEYKQAIADTTRAIELSEGNDYFYFLRGRAYSLNKAYQLATADLEQAIELAPDKPEYTNELARISNSQPLSNLPAGKSEQTKKIPGIPSLIASLRSGDKTVVKDAAKTLENIGEPAIEPLVVALQKETISIKYKIARIIGEIGGQKAVEVLLTILKDNSGNMKQIAATALGNIGNLMAIEPLIEVLKDEDDNVRYITVNALAKIGDERALSTLEYMAKEDKGTYALGHKVSEAASKAIEQIKARHNIT